METTLNRYLHLRFKPRRKNFTGCEECPAFDCFDWVVWTPDARRFMRFKKLRPRYVLCLARRRSLRTLLRLRPLLKDVVLVIAGEDTLLSALRPEVDALMPYCRSIHFEAKDIEHPRVRSFCMGFNSFYLRRMSEEFLNGQIAAVADPGWRKNGVLVAWGAIWKFLDDELDERRAAAQFVEASDWLERVELEAEEYFRRLAASKYLLAPAGQGVQAPKLAEAWLMRTVPVVIRNPCFEDLDAAGYPLVLLDKWEDLTPERLEAYEEVRGAVDWEKVREMLTLGYFCESVLGKGDVKKDS